MSVVAAYWLWSAALTMITSLAMTSSTDRRNVTELRIVVVVPSDERWLFSRRRVLPAVRDALQPDDVTDRLVLDSNKLTDRLVPGHNDVKIREVLIAGNIDTKLVPSNRTDNLVHKLVPGYNEVTDTLVLGSNRLTGRLVPGYNYVNSVGLGWYQVTGYRRSDLLHNR